MNGFPAGPTRKKTEKSDSLSQKKKKKIKKKFLHTIISRLSQSGLFVLLRYFFCCIPISTLCCFIFSTRGGIVRSSNDKWINRKQKKRVEKTQTAKSLRQSVNVSNDCRSISLCKLFIHIFTPDLFFTSLWLVETKKKKLKNGYINLRQNEKRIGDEVVENVGRTNKFRSDLHDSLLPPPLSLFRFRQQMFMIRNSGADEWHSTTNVYTMATN
jgi:hypothetical protein